MKTTSEMRTLSLPLAGLTPSPTLLLWFCNKYLFTLNIERSRIFLLISDFLFALCLKKTYYWPFTSQKLLFWLGVFLDLWFDGRWSNSIILVDKKSRKSELYCLYTTLASIYPSQLCKLVSKNKVPSTKNFAAHLCIYSKLIHSNIYPDYPWALKEI